MFVKKLMAVTLTLALLAACSGGGDGGQSQGNGPSTEGDAAMTNTDNPQFAPANGPTAVIKTTMGDITVQLYPEEASKAVENFITHVGFDDGGGAVCRGQLGVGDFGHR